MGASFVCHSFPWKLTVYYKDLKNITSSVYDMQYMGRVILKKKWRNFKIEDAQFCVESSICDFNCHSKLCTKWFVHKVTILQNYNTHQVINHETPVHSVCFISNIYKQQFRD